MGFVNNSSGVPGSGQDNGAAIMRGPMAGKVVTQLLKGTDWGELDVLILDLPPGTGDVQLAVCQELALSGAVAVTTPSKLAAIDTRKGIEMFTSLGVPTLAVVENMSYFEVRVCVVTWKFFASYLVFKSCLFQTLPIPLVICSVKVVAGTIRLEKDCWIWTLVVVGVAPM
jgi:Mrp family chromosome partitioning ATPase